MSTRGSESVSEQVVHRAAYAAKNALCLFQALSGVTNTVVGTSYWEEEGPCFHELSAHIFI